MSYINPLHYNSLKRFPIDMPNNIFNNILANQLHFNQLIAKNLYLSQLNRITQKNESDSFNQINGDMPFFGQSNPNLNHAKFIAYYAFYLQSQNFNMLGNLSHLNNNSIDSYNNNLINFLQNHYFSNLPIRENNCSSTEIKTVNFPNQPIINQQKQILSNGVIMNSLDKSKSDSEAIRVPKENTPRKPTKNYLKKKTKRVKNRKEDDDDDEDEKSSSFKSKFSEKNSTSSTFSIIKHSEKKNTRKILKFEEKNLMLGTKEEYEKFFKNDRSTNEFSEKEKNLIEMINNPRRKKKKSNDPKISEYLLSPEKIQELNEELKAYVPLYETDLEEAKKDKYTMFMISNFPEMFKIQNFYLHLKKNIEKKKDLSKNKLNATIPLIDKKYKETLSIKSIWKANECENRVVEEYLYEVEKIWPIDEYKFSQEVSLQLLRHNNYHIENSIRMITSKDSLFKSLIKHLAQLKY